MDHAVAAIQLPPLQEIRSAISLADERARLLRRLLRLAARFQLNEVEAEKTKSVKSLLVESHVAKRTDSRQAVVA